MNCLDFEQANTNLFPKINNGNPVYMPNTGLIPVHRDKQGNYIMKLAFTPEEITRLLESKGEFFLTFSRAQDISSIQSTVAFPVDLVDKPADIQDDSDFQ
jgi:hypothetical protein